MCWTKRAQTAPIDAGAKAPAYTCSDTGAGAEAPAYTCSDTGARAEAPAYICPFRNTLPARTPVNSPSRRAIFPFTSTQSIPSASWCGFV